MFILSPTIILCSLFKGLFIQGISNTNIHYSLFPYCCNVLLPFLLWHLTRWYLNMFVLSPTIRLCSLFKGHFIQDISNTNIHYFRTVSLPCGILWYLTKHDRISKKLCSSRVEASNIFE